MNIFFFNSNKRNFNDNNSLTQQFFSLHKSLQKINTFTTSGKKKKKKIKILINTK